MVSELITDNGSPITNSYIWGLDLSGSLQGAGGIGGLLAATKGTNIYFATYDGNGNVSEYLSAEGEIVAHYEYDPFGNQLVADGELAHEFLHRFSTKPYEENTALVLYEFRIYLPPLARFITKDPIGEHGFLKFNLSSKKDKAVLHLYSFVNGNPISKIDNLGLACLNPQQKSSDQDNEREKICQEAINAKLADENVMGTVICKLGKPYPCVFAPKKFHPGVRNCILRHEESHVSDGIATCDPKRCDIYVLTAPESKAVESECIAYKVGLQCYNELVENGTCGPGGDGCFGWSSMESSARFYLDTKCKGK